MRLILGLSLLLLFGTPLAAADLNAADMIAAGLEARFLQLEDARDAGDRWLQRQVNHPDPEVRRRAALALGRIGSSPAVHPLLVRARVEEDPEVRARLAFALGLTGSDRTRGVLMDFLRSDPSPRVRGRAAEAMGRVGFGGETLLTSLETETDPWALARIEVALYRVLRGKLAGNPATETRLTALLGNRAEEAANRWMAVWTLARLGLGEAILLEAIADPDPGVRGWAVRGLGSASSPEAGQGVLAATRDPVVSVRIHAIRALGKRSGDRARQELIRIARTPGTADERREALAALASHPGPRTRGVLEAAGREATPWAPTARSSLATIAPGTDYVLASRKHLVDGDVLGNLDWVRQVGVVFEHRTKAGSAGSGRGKESERGRPMELVAVLGAIARGESPGLDPDPILSLAALSSLATRPESGVDFDGFLASEDPLLRGVAAEAILDLDGLRGLDRVMAARGTGPGEEDYALALITRLAKLRDAQKPGSAERGRVREALGRLAADPSRLVRLAALEALEVPTLSQRQRAQAPRARRPVEHYAALLSDLPRRAWLETTRGTLLLELDAEHAPLTVANFVRLAREGFFDDLPISRVVPDFVVQMGDVRGDLNGSPGYTIRCEAHEQSYTRGMVGMALAGKDTGGCQFFVTHSPQPHLDGIYTIFGRVLEGMTVVDHLQRKDRILTIRPE